MPSINILPLNLRNKIAAGEVVERPASVVKELIENSVDAGATKIEIDIAKAGRRLIRVSDNGIGMDREDALLAFERYATSKIKDENDLFNIRTMGFRGEALSSIASVSKVRLITAPQILPHPLLARVVTCNGLVKGGKGGLIGICIEIIGGDIKEVKDCSTIGTTIEVKDLFFNTPARRKFLKSDSTENYHIIDTATRIALSHYQIGFILRIDGEDVLNLPAALSCRERLTQVFGKAFVDELIETRAEDREINLHAFTGRSTNLRTNRNNQYIFINNRPVKDQTVSYAVYKSYEGAIPKDKHPVFFLFINLNPEKVDFNVHPAKREVRFEDKSRIFEFVYQAAKSEIRSQNIEIEKIRSWEDENNQVSEKRDSFYTGYTGAIPFLYLGDTFIAIAEKDGITLIDYHALHERINYERFLRRSAVRSQESGLTKNDMPSYRLLFPQQVKLQSSEYRMILENLNVLNELGLEVEDFGHNTVIVRSLPEFLENTDLKTLISDVAASLSSEIRSPLNDCGDKVRTPGRDIRGQGSEFFEGIEPIDSVKKMLAAKLACHSSIRGREIPDGARIVQLLKDLEALENPNTCPHGRATRIFISMDDLRKMFKK